jgi:hypothetical protein
MVNARIVPPDEKATKICKMASLLLNSKQQQKKKIAYILRLLLLHCFIRFA